MNTNTNFFRYVIYWLQITNHYPLQHIKFWEKSKCNLISWKSHETKQSRNSELPQLFFNVPLPVTNMAVILPLIHHLHCPSDMSVFCFKCFKGWSSFIEHDLNKCHHIPQLSFLAPSSLLTLHLPPHKWQASQLTQHTMFSLSSLSSALLSRLLASLFLCKDLPHRSKPAFPSKPIYHVYISTVTLSILHCTFQFTHLSLLDWCSWRVGSTFYSSVYFQNCPTTEYVRWTNGLPRWIF